MAAVAREGCRWGGLSEESSAPLDEKEANCLRGELAHLPTMRYASINSLFALCAVCARQRQKVVSPALLRQKVEAWRTMFLRGCRYEANLSRYRLEDAVPPIV